MDMDIQLKATRKKYTQLSQQDVADRLGVKIATYGAWERGTNTPGIAYVFECAKIFGCSVYEIVGIDIDGSSELNELVGKLNALGIEKLVDYAKLLCGRPEYVESRSE